MLIYNCQAMLGIIDSSCYKMYKASSLNPMDLIIEPDEDRGGFYLGNIQAARNTDLLLKHQIRAVLTVAEGAGLNYKNEIVKFHLVLLLIEFKVINAQDNLEYDISKDLEQAV